MTIIVDHSSLKYVTQCIWDVVQKCTKVLRCYNYHFRVKMCCRVEN